MKTIFEKIIDGEIPSVKIHEDELCIAIMDINPLRKGHCLIISKTSYPNFTDCPKDELSHMMEMAKKADLKLREKIKCDGTNIVINNGPAANQEIPHLHIHVIPRDFNDGIKLKAIHEKYEDGEINKLGEILSF